MTRITKKIKSESQVNQEATIEEEMATNSETNSETSMSAPAKSFTWHEGKMPLVNSIGQALCPCCDVERILAGSKGTPLWINSMEKDGKRPTFMKCPVNLNHGRYMSEAWEILEKIWLPKKPLCMPICECQSDIKMFCCKKTGRVSSGTIFFSCKCNNSFFMDSRIFDKDHPLHEWSLYIDEQKYMDIIKPQVKQALFPVRELKK